MHVLRDPRFRACPIMRFPFMINTLFILSAIASTSNPELISPVNDDSIFQDTSQTDLSPSSSFDQPTSLFDQAKLPEDLDFGAVSNPSESLFQETSSSSLSDDESFFSQLALFLLRQRRDRRGHILQQQSFRNRERLFAIRKSSFSSPDRQEIAYHWSATR